MTTRIAVIFLLPFVLLAQDASLSLSGTVVSSTGEPLAHALVTLAGYVAPLQVTDGKLSNLIQKSALTDATGGFHFFALPAAQYSVSAQKPGFQPDFSPASRTASVDLKSSTDTVRVVLTPMGVATGTVTDQFRQPMRGVIIAALTSNVIDGLRQARTLQTATTDDRGTWRMGNLSPGKYYFKATGQGGATILPGSPGSARMDIGDSFLPVYSDGAATLVAAMPVEVTGGSHAVADFRLNLQPAWRITGALQNFSPTEPYSFTIEVGGEEVVAGPDRFNGGTGAFEFRDVPGGSYVLHARQGNKSGEALVRVDGGDSAALVLELYPAIDIPVHERFTNPKPAPVPPQPDDGRGPCGVSVAPESNGLSAGGDIGGNNGLHNVPVGEHRLVFRCYGGYIRSALMGTQDLLANPVVRIAPNSMPPSVEILATYGGGTLNGRLEGEAPASPPHYLLVPQFSGSGGPLAITGTPLQFGGGFTFRDLAPGRYTLYAFARADIEFREPSFLKSLTGGQSVQIEDGKEQEVVVKEVIQ